MTAGHGIARWIVLLVAAVLLAPATNRIALQLFGGGPGERSLYVKLPLDQPRFHWKFVDEEALLAGALEIEIHGADGQDTILTVFRDGAIAPGWRAIEASEGEGEIYFGFIGDVGVRTHPKDSVVVRLTAVEDLDGIGRYHRGVLPRGKHEAAASYRTLTGHPQVGLLPARENPRAYVGCWREKWALDVTERVGWSGARPEAGLGSWLRGAVGFVAKERGADGQRCLR